MENHRTASLSHGLLSRNIRLALALPREERKKDGLKFVEDCKAEYDRLLEQSPAIPSNVLTEFEKEYPFDNIFTKPEILNVRSIPNFRGPKTVEPLHAITKNTPLERVGKLFKKDNVEEEEESIEEEEQEYDEEIAIDDERDTVAK